MRENIQLNVKDAKIKVETASQQICDAIVNLEQHLLCDLDHHETEALMNVKSYERDAQHNKARGITLKRESESLYKSGKAFDRVSQTPVLREQLDASLKRAKPANMTWEFVHENDDPETMESVEHLLGKAELLKPTSL